MIKQLTPNYEIQKQSAISQLKLAFAEYRKAVTKYLNMAGFNDDGIFYEYAGLKEKISEYEKEVVRLKFKLDEIKAEMGEQE